MTLSIVLPTSERRLERYVLTGELIADQSRPPSPNRIVFAAAHVVADPLSEEDPSAGSAIDDETTLAFRRHLLDLGLGVA